MTSFLFHSFSFFSRQDRHLYGSFLLYISHLLTLARRFGFFLDAQHEYEYELFGNTKE